MAELNKKIKTALDESRMLVLGTQILLGFQYRVFFEKSFEQLSPTSQYLKLSALGILLLAIALIMWPGAYHRIVWRGNDSRDVHEFTSGVMDVALLPFVIALSIDFYVIGSRIMGTRTAIALGGFIGFVALALLYGLGGLSRLRRWDRELKSKKRRDAEVPKTELHDKIDQVLTEARVVLPGAQALLGFELITILMEEFDKLPSSSRYVHLISLVLMGITVILLMAPAAYHRLVERGEDTEHFHKVASTLLLLAMIPLPVGICGDLFVVIRKVTESTLAGIIGAATALVSFYGLWFGFTAYRRSKVRSRAV
jgi:uncharacterized protein DUF6328